MHVRHPPPYPHKSPLQFPFQRVFGESEEEDRGAKVNYDWRLPPSRFTQQGLKFGWEIRDRDRATAFRRFGIDCRGCEWKISDGRGENVFDRTRSVRWVRGALFWRKRWWATTSRP